jgi:IS605 OrfB family transposase
MKSSLPFLQRLNDSNRAKRFAFQTIVREKRWNRHMHEKSLHLVLKQKYGLNDYYANSTVQEAKALFKALLELQTLYKKQTKEKLHHLKTKLKKERTRRTNLQKMKQSCINGNLIFPKNTRFSKTNNLITLQLKHQTLKWSNEYLFEHQYVDIQLKQTKARIGHLLNRQKRLEQKLTSYITHIPSAVFGSKKLFKSQFTNEAYQQNHKKWREIFLRARNKQLILSGRKDAKYGNFTFQYNVHSHQLSIRLSDGQTISLSDVMFPYGQGVIETTIQTQMQCPNKKKYGKPIAWSVEDHGEYYIIKCLFDVPTNPSTNYSTSDGVIGVDCNPNHFAWASVTQDGNYKTSGTLPFTILGKTTGQITKIIEAEAICLVDVAWRYNKPIVIEKLNTATSKTGDTYGNKRVNFLKSMFAYKKMTSAIINRANKVGVAVVEVNPTYTSISGKMKYMRKLGISVHQAAAWTIGRRGLGYKEKVPTILQAFIIDKTKHHWSRWNQLNKRLDIRTHHFYNLYNVNRPTESLQIHAVYLSKKEEKKIKELVV